MKTGLTCVLLLLSLIFCLACGVKAPPLPPERETPAGLPSTTPTTPTGTVR